ncbi:MAG: peptidylprolyl isomerase [Spirulinaceae cyanobacterium]
MISLSVGLSGAWWDFGEEETSYRQSRLPQGNAITDPTAILRYALPIENNTIRKLQQSLEDIANELRGKRWSPISRDVKEASRYLGSSDKILASIPNQYQPQAESLLAQMKDEVSQLREAVDAQDKEEVWTLRREILAQITDLERFMVEEFPFEVPTEYANLPQLKGRATVEMETNKGNLVLVVDGYNSPVTAGNFVDLVEKGFYNGLPFIRAEDNYILQTGDPEGVEEGYIDPQTGEYRAIPLEIKIRSELEPIYGNTLEELGLYREETVLPISAYGALGMARPGNEPNGGSSQFFFFLFEPALAPAGLNLLDGRYAVFGYTVEGKEVLEQLRAGDEIISAKVVEGLDNLVKS